MVGVTALILFSAWVISKPIIPEKEGLVEAFSGGLQQPVGSRIKVDEMAAFPWDQFCVLGGYSSKGDAEAIMGMEWPYWWIPQLQEGHRRYVFTFHGEVVAAFDSPNDEWTPIDVQDVCLTPDQAVLEVAELEFVSGTRSVYRIASSKSG